MKPSKIVSICKPISHLVESLQTICIKSVDIYIPMCPSPPNGPTGTCELREHCNTIGILGPTGTTGICYDVAGTTGPTGCSIY